MSTNMTSKSTTLMGRPTLTKVLTRPIQCLNSKITMLVAMAMMNSVTTDKTLEGQTTTIITTTEHSHNNQLLLLLSNRTLASVEDLTLTTLKRR
jgi:hypothetical protein